MCIFLLIFNNKDKLMTIFFYLRTLWPKYPPFFFIFCYLERLCLYNREIILAVLLRQTGKTNMTKNRDEIVIFQKKNHDMIFLPYRPPLLKNPQIKKTTH